MTRHPSANVSGGGGEPACTGDKSIAGVRRSAKVRQIAEVGERHRGHAPNYDVPASAKEGISGAGVRGIGFAVTSSRSGAVPR